MSNHWYENAACKGMETNLFFSDGSVFAKMVCRTCPVKDACLQEALDTGSRGIWGGTTEYERNGMKRRQRGVSPTRTHCPKNHEYTPENTYWRTDGTRNCRTCVLNAKQAYRDAHRKPKATHCKRNHEFTPENTYQASNGTRACRTCRRDLQRIRVASRVAS
jgi:WhiB family redox-sensing transcriptional regulator